MEEEKTQIEEQEEQEELSYDETESGLKTAEEALDEGEDADEGEDELEKTAAELLEKHPEIAERLRSGEEIFGEGFFENIKSGMSPSAAYEHEELKAKLAASEAEAERYKQLYKTESRLRQNKERSSGSLRGEGADSTPDAFELGFLED